MTHHTGAVLQRDGKTYAVVTRIPAGIVIPDTLEKIAYVARKYQVPMVKLTSGQRFMLVGIPEKDLASLYRDLGPLAAKETAPCVKYVQTCLGTDVCRFGVQDSIALGLELEEQYHEVSFPAKLKFGGFRLSPLLRGELCQGYRTCGRHEWMDRGIWGKQREKAIARKRDCEGFIRADALDLVHRLLEYYRNNAGPKERTARFFERIGFDRLRSELLTLLPYIRLEIAR